jgi:hypothetical protein
MTGQRLNSPMKKCHVIDTRSWPRPNLAGRPRGSSITGLLAALGLALTGEAVTSRTRTGFGPCIAPAFWLVRPHGGLLDRLSGRP